MSRISQQRRSKGFTLVEVLIALTIIAVALAAIITTVSATVRNYGFLQEKTFAHWVAMNKMAEIQMMRQWPSPRSTRGSMVMAEHEWFWEMDVQNTEDKTVRKVIIRVKLKEDDENSVTSLTGFVGRPT
ncbi:MAG: type II secretion system minor pseudopilin GspI [Gammaproteobacteria bacterium]|nr:type II secretion system minor pseudopilin GspI [Gammaproteobacteria bacterium]MDH5801894.1 type II secretion system minor pseudopilin GspI [Gammaproteobacteria bacterium]